MSSISIIGSGNMARAIGTAALRAGNTVEIAGRDAVKTADAVRALGDGATAGTWGAPPSGDIVILARTVLAVLRPPASVQVRVPTEAPVVDIDLTDPALGLGQDLRRSVG